MSPTWLVDAGPLIALVLRTDQDHVVCAKTAASIPGPLMTTWPVLTEVVHVLGAIRNQDAILEMVERGSLQILALDAGDVPRVRTLMRKYAARPMDLADATLVRVAERESIYRIFTLDADFRVYRIGRQQAFTVAP